MEVEVRMTLTNDRVGYCKDETHGQGGQQYMKVSVTNVDISKTEVKGSHSNSAKQI